MAKTGWKAYTEETFRESKRAIEALLALGWSLNAIKGVLNRSWPTIDRLHRAHNLVEYRELNRLENNGYSKHNPNMSSTVTIPTQIEVRTETDQLDRIEGLLQDLCEKVGA